MPISDRVRRYDEIATRSRELLGETVRSPPLETRLGLERGHACRDRSHLVQPGEERGALVLQVLNRVAVHDGHGQRECTEPDRRGVSESQARRSAAGAGLAGREQRNPSCGARGSPR